MCGWICRPRDGPEGSFRERMCLKGGFRHLPGVSADTRVRHRWCPACHPAARQNTSLHVSGNGNSVQFLPLSEVPKTWPTRETQ